MDTHGTPTECTEGQLATITARIVTQLPKARRLSKVPTKSLLLYTQNGDQLARVVAEAFKMLYNGHASLARPPKQKKKLSRIIGGLLEEVGKPIKLAGHKRFVASEKFVINTDGEVPFSEFGPNFENNFLAVDEPDVKPITVKQRKLRKPSVDGPILKALGDTVENIVRARIALAHVFNFLKTADRTGWYIFYVADAKDKPWAVYAYWDGLGWFVGANAVSHPHEWHGGSCVVSC
jgi:hypothetical protein